MVCCGGAGEVRVRKTPRDFTAREFHQTISRHTITHHAISPPKSHPKSPRGRPPRMHAVNTNVTKSKAPTLHQFPAPEICPINWGLGRKWDLKLYHPELEGRSINWVISDEHNHGPPLFHHPRIPPDDSTARHLTVRTTT